MWKQWARQTAPCGALIVTTRYYVHPAMKIPVAGQVIAFLLIFEQAYIFLIRGV
jgi:hypothetical protein